MPIAPMPRLTGAPQVPAADLLELKRSVFQWCTSNPERLLTMLCTERGLDLTLEDGTPVRATVRVTLHPESYVDLATKEDSE
jgi:hypothetical protein